MSDSVIQGFTGLVSVLVFVSMAAERLVEMIKGWIPALSVARSDPLAEGRRRAILHLLAVAAGTAITGLTYSTLANMGGMTWLASVKADDRPWVVVGIGLLSAGGSSFWNSILTYMLSLKDVKRVEADEAKQQSAGPNPLAALGHAITPPTRASAG